MPSRIASYGAVRLSLGASTASIVAAAPFTAQLSAPVPEEWPPPVMLLDRPSSTAARFSREIFPEEAFSGFRHSAEPTASPVSVRAVVGYTRENMMSPPIFVPPSEARAPALRNATG